MRILPMEEKHLDALAQLEAVCFAHPWSRQSLAEELSNEDSLFLVAEEEGEVLGYAGMHIVLGEGYTDNVAVFPAHRKKGVGRALMQGLLAALREKDGVFLTLEVRPSNTAAVSLYTSLGFQQVGIRKNFYQDPAEDALLLTYYFEKKDGAL